MSAGDVNLTLEQGATFQKVIRWKDAAQQPVDLTGCTARMQVRDKPGGRVYLDLTTDDGIVIDPLAGKLTLTAYPDKTSEVRIVKGVFDLLVSDGVGATRLLEGKVRVSPAVTA